MVLQAQGHARIAFDMLLTLGDEMESLGDRLELAEVHQAQSQSLYSLHNYEAALAYLSRSEQLLVGSGSQMSRADVLISRGWLYLELGDLPAAEECLSVAYTVHDDQHIHFWRILHGLARCATARGSLNEAASYYHRASFMIARIRHTLANEHASSGLFIYARQLYGDAIRLAVEMDDAVMILTLAEQQRALVLQQHRNTDRLHIPVELTARYEHKRQQLRATIWEARSHEHLNVLLTEYTDLLLQMSYSSPELESEDSTLPDLDWLRTAFNQAFPEGWIVLNYVECNDHLLIVVFDRVGLFFDRTPLDRHLKHLLDLTCLAGTRDLTYRDWSHLRNPNRRPWDTLSTLAERLLPPHVRAQLHPNLRLLIVPSGRLHSLPWAPLRVGSQWLCEQAIVQLLPSLSLWRPSTIEPEANQAALLIGCSQFSRRARDLFTITTELNCIANVWPSEVTQLVNDAATRDAILKLDAHGRLNKYAVLHIATHAQLIAAQGLLAHVMFWDEDFLYDEVARLRLNNVLVVLSTCNGALSEVLPGEEVLSLNRAFLRAGARDVIANLWPSYDLASPHLMQLLYENIAAGLDAAESVAQMQRQLITQTEAVEESNVEYCSPLVWGGMHVMGHGTARLRAAGGTPREAQRT